VQLYHRLLRKYVLAQLGDVALNKITTVLVRE
jgi:hypothetical protein